MSSRSTIAIITPFYNEPELLLKSVLTVFNQKNVDWHLYIIDDGSDVGKRVHETLPHSIINASNVTVAYKKNEGPAMARNFAIQMITAANHKFVAYLDADDQWDEDYLQNQLFELQFDNLQFIYSSVRYKFINGDTAVPYGIAFFEKYPGTEELIKNNFIYISGVVHTVKCLEVGVFDHDLNGIEDHDYWVRIAKARFTIKRNPNACFTYIVKPNGNGGKLTLEVSERFRLKHPIQ